MSLSRETRSEAQEPAGEPSTSSADGLVISYLTLRKAVGVLGIALPIVLAVGDLTFGNGRGLQPTISDYYATGMRDVFVGLLFPLGLFLANGGQGQCQREQENESSAQQTPNRNTCHTHLRGVNE